MSQRGTLGGSVVGWDDELELFRLAPRLSCAFQVQVDIRRTPAITIAIDVFEAGDRQFEDFAAAQLSQERVTGGAWHRDGLELESLDRVRMHEVRDQETLAQTDGDQLVALFATELLEQIPHLDTTSEPQLTTLVVIIVLVIHLDFLMTELGDVVAVGVVGAHFRPVGELRSPLFGVEPVARELERDHAGLFLQFDALIASVGLAAAFLCELGLGALVLGFGVGLVFELVLELRVVHD